MKVAEFTKLINAALKRASKARSWSSSGYTAFKREGPLFFYVTVLPSGKGRGLVYSVQYKLIAMEDLFWKIIGTPANSDAPLSVRAKGVYALAGMEIRRHNRPECEWTAELLEYEMVSLLTEAVARAEAVSARVRTLDQNLAYIEELASSQPAAPDVLGRVRRAQVLTHLLKGEVSAANAIVEEQIHAHDPGDGVRLGGHSFYEWVKWHIEAMA